MKLWRYLLRDYIVLCVVSYASLLLFFSVFEFAEFVRIVAQANEGMALVWEMTGWNMFVITGELGPLALLLAVTLFGANLSRRGEIVAIVGAGISPWKLLMPVVLITSMFCGFFFVVANTLAPRGLARNQYINAEILKRGTRIDYYYSRERHWYRSGDKFVRVGEVHSEDQTYKDVTVMDVRDGHLQARYDAPSVIAVGGELLAQDVTVRRYPLGEDTVDLSEDHALLLPTARYFNAFLDMTGRPQRMNLEQLHTAAEVRRRQGYDPRVYESEYHSRTWAPFTVLALVLLAATFALRVDVKRPLVRALVELLALAGGAFLLRQIFRSLGGGGLIPPMIAAMLPCFCVIAYAWHRMRAVLGMTLSR